MKAKKTIFVALLVLLVIASPVLAQTEIKNYRHIEGREMILGLSYEEWLAQSGRDEAELGRGSSQADASKKLTTAHTASSAPAKLNLSSPSSALLTSVIWLLASITAALFLTFIGLPTLAQAFDESYALGHVSRRAGFLTIAVIIAGVPILLAYAGATATYVLSVVSLVSILGYGLRVAGDTSDRIARGLVR